MTGKRVLEKRLRMVLDFEVTVEELNDEALRAHYRRSENFDELVSDRAFWENVTRQIRLQGALLEDEEALKKYLTYVVAVEVDASAESRVAEVFGVGGERQEEEIFGPLFGRLSEEDEKFYEEVSEGGVLFDNVEALSRAVRVRWVGGRLEEVRAVAGWKMDDAESDNLM